jgi:hypothetical protein
MPLDINSFDNNIDVDISASQCLEVKNQSNRIDSKITNYILIYFLDDKTRKRNYKTYADEAERSSKEYHKRD